MRVLRALLPWRVGALAILWFLPQPSPAADDVPLPSALSASTLSVDDAIARAMAVDPGVQSALAELQQAQGLRAAAAFLLNNPTASGDWAANTTGRFSVSVRQPLSISGEGWHARAAAAAGIDAAEAGLTRARLRSAASVRRAYVAAIVASRQARVAEDGLDLAHRLTDAVQKQQAVGEAPLLDLRLTRLAAAEAAGNLLTARALEAQALTALAGVVGRPVSAGELLVDPLVLAPAPSDAPAGLRSDQVAAQARVTAAQADIRRARAAALPPLAVGFSVEQEEGETFVGPSFQWTLPLFTFNQAATRRAAAQAHVADAAATSLDAQVATEVATARDRVAEAHRVSEDILLDPFAEATQALQSIEAAYLAGEMDLAQTLVLQRQVLQGESAAIGLLGQTAYTRIDLLLATDDPALLGGAL